MLPQTTLTKNGIKSLKTPVSQFATLIALFAAHFAHHLEPKFNMKPTKTGIEEAYFPDKFERLQDENKHLKTAQRDLEEQIKLIATRLKR